MVQSVTIKAIILLTKIISLVRRAFKMEGFATVVNGFLVIPLES